MNLNDKELKELLGIALKGNEFAEIYYEKNISFSVKIENSKISDLNQGIDEGVGLRIVNDKKTIYGYTNDITYLGIEKLAEKLNIKNSDLGTEKIEKFKLKKSDIKVERAYNKVDIDEKIDLVKKSENYAKSLTEKEIVQFTVQYSDVNKEIKIVNSLGKICEEEINRGVLRGEIIVKDGDNTQRAYLARGTSLGFEYFTDDLRDNMVEEIIKSSEIMLKADDAESGKFDVVLDGKAGGTMIHEACGHGLELDLVQDEISIFRGKIGEKIANEKVTVIDSGRIKGFFGTTYFDGEGNETEETVLVENGVLKQYMTSYVSEKNESKRYTGSGRRQTYKYQPIPRMRNTFIKAGTDKREDIIKSVKKGVYITKMGGGQVDTSSGDFVFAAQEAFMIEDGKIMNPIKGVSLIGNGADILKNITAVGDDLGFTIGFCGKAGQSIPVTSGQPTVKIGGLVVGGVK